jgi:hypothetical protein
MNVYSIDQEVLKQSSKELQASVRDAMRVCRGNEIGSTPCADALFKVSELADKELEVIRQGEGRTEKVRYGGAKIYASTCCSRSKGKTSGRYNRRTNCKACVDYKTFEGPGRFERGPSSSWTRGLGT